EFFGWIRDPEERCVRCYEMRLGRTARWARQRGYSFFATTLTISPYQKVESIFKVGEDLQEKEQVIFLKKDFRSGFAESVKISKELGLYRQNYCGCIFSKWEGVKRRVWKSLTGQGSL
ncbi:MAG: epoxyqueuosine reductase QueH, partial [Candidatus Atribacteria bacterium]|nr:epoxyqueuosine reductase QueH [Candidatus Atribacteria bacterium]MCD6349586.1 epoxyqueuosine reductase QueH [Candidatus Atribacteria bacterium]